MTESHVLVWTCEKCGHHNFPHGHLPSTVPAQIPLAKCEKCGHTQRDLEWSDSETKVLMDRQDKGLPLFQGTRGKTSAAMSSIEAKIKILEESRNADRKEMELVRKMLDDLIQVELKKVRDSALERDQDLATLTARVKELEEWKKFSEENK